MSDYRDDSNDTAVISDTTWLGLSAVSEGTARISETVLYGLLVLHTDTAVASDETLDRPAHLLVDQATASDEASDQLRARVLVVETATAADRVTGTLHVLHTDGATASDAVLDRVRSLAVDGARVADEAFGTRHAFTLVLDTVRISDSTGQAASVLVEDAATASDQASGTLRGRVLLVDGATLADEVVDAHQAVQALLVDGARLAALVLDHLAAHDLVTDAVVIEDSTVGGEQDHGQAWTANVDSWAMSRYAPYTFSSLAVIDGKLYGIAADGVYALDGDSDAVAGSIATGKLDVGQGALVHPHTAYLEYELDADGTAAMDVTTTQSGSAATYSYPLERELADELTNGRFKFGRGLRGRHFTFTLRLTGRHGYINDLRVESAPTNRRV
ncbi:hypothetical protein [Pseudomonas aeruginosa]|uniref:hypothetical protein n=1 Tax=Pseudomonas aeruginosa TaxID=287 RepID=UPI00163BFAAC|nr:hypothetical protein [Pseudomonas aeruginosa]WOT60869.1 hypothetical protein R5018_25080 [Pseudomonas aeruginosa]WOT74323.1 hypothetical protein R5026_27875 [Pseudomonas aeruginosa]WOT85444.1 hypothetical protein R5020_18835 [Pseudomonas aeruginosa]WOT98399.1 hypothetical protein R5015_18770 [Pseudomonas aeruginosa]WOU42000.1 hypothetical protein R5029_15910 [Pseudomonas aeruginosa]